MNDFAGFANADREIGNRARHVRVGEKSGLLRMMALPSGDEKMLMAMSWGWRPSDVAAVESIPDDRLRCGQGAH
jgi:hypothetical protein